MKLKLALSFILISLFFNNVYAVSPDASTCVQALEKNDLNAALVLAKKAISINKSDYDALICQGRVLAAKGELDSALTSFKLADTQSTDAFEKAIATLLVGRTQYALKQNDIAIASFQQTIAHAVTAKNKGFERVGHNAIGDVYFDNNQLEQALTEYLLANKLAANDNERGSSSEKIALTYHKMNTDDLALEYQIRAYLMYETVGTLDEYARSGIELGRYYSISKQYVSAENVLNKIIKLAKEQGGAYYEAKGSCVLAKVKVVTGDVPTAKGLVQYAKEIAKNSKDKEFEQEIEQETSGLF
jgi:tetratricopeptide (TPR) repeat protein